MLLALAVLRSALTGTMNENGVLTIEGSEDVTSNLFEEAVKSIQKEKVTKIIFKGSKNINSLPHFIVYTLLKTIEFDGVKKLGNNVFYLRPRNKIEFILGESMEEIESNFMYYKDQNLKLNLGPNLKKIDKETISFLESFTIDSNNKYLYTVDNRTLLDKIDSSIIGIAQSHGENFVSDYRVPDKIKMIKISGKYCFKVLDLNEIESVMKDTQFEAESVQSFGKLSEIYTRQFQIKNQKSIKLPKSITKLGSNPFGFNITIDINGNENFEIKDSFLISKIDNTIIQYNSDEGIESYLLDGKQYKISKYSLSNCHGKSLTVKNIKVIPAYAFAYSRIQKIILDGVEEIQEYAFYDMRLFGVPVDVDYGTSLKSIGSYAFQYSSLTGLPKTLESIEGCAFEYVDFYIKGNVLEIPKKLKKVPYRTFQYITIHGENESVKPIVSFEGSDVEEIEFNVFSRNKDTFGVKLNDDIKSITYSDDWPLYTDLIVKGGFTYSPNKKHLLRCTLESEPQDKTLKIDGILSIGSTCFSNKNFQQTTLEFPDVTEIYSNAFSNSKFGKAIFGKVKKLTSNPFSGSSFNYLKINLYDLEGSEFYINDLKIGIPDIQMPKNLEELSQKFKFISILGIDGFFENPLTLNDYYHNVTISSTKTEEKFTTKCVVSGDVSQEIAFNIWCNEVIFDETVKEIKGYSFPKIWEPSTNLNSVTFKAVEYVESYLDPSAVLPKKFVFPPTLKKFPGGWLNAEFVDNGGQIELSDSLPYKVEGNLVISKDGKTIYGMMLKSGEKPSIPSTVTTLEEGSLSSIRGGSITIPGTVSSVINALPADTYIDLILSEGVKKFKQLYHSFLSIKFPVSIEDVDVDITYLYLAGNIIIPDGCKGFKTVGNMLITSNYKHFVAATTNDPESLEFDCERVRLEQELNWPNLKKVTFSDRVKCIEGENFQKVQCTMEIPQLNYYPGWMRNCNNMVGNVTVSIGQDEDFYISGLPNGFNIILNVYEEPEWAKGNTLDGKDIKVYAPRDYKGDTFMGIPVIREDRDVVVPETEDPGSNSGAGSLSGGEIAGIVIGVIVAVAAIGAILFFFVFKKRMNSDVEDSNSGSSGKNEV